METTLKTLSATTLSINDTLANIGKTLIEKHTELGAIQEAISIRRQEMEDLHGVDKIALEISDLEAMRNKMIQDNDQIRRDLVGSRDREESEFRYRLCQERLEEKDDWMAHLRVRNNQERDRRDAFDRDLALRGQALQEQENSYKEALTKVATFDADVEKRVNAEVGKERGILTGKFEQEKRILAIEHTAQVAGLQKDVDHARQVIASKDAEILTLREQLATAVKAQTDLASKTVEGANDRKSLSEMQAIITNVGGNGTRART